MSTVLSTSVNLAGEDKARIAAVKERTAVIESLLIGRNSEGAGLADVIRKGLDAYEAEISAVAWTPEHEALLSRRREAEGRGAAGGAALAAEARARGFGPGTFRADKAAAVAEAARLRGLGVSFQQIGDLFGVSRQSVHEWLRPREESPAHVASGTAVSREPGGDPVMAAEVPAPRSRKRGRPS